MNYRTYLRTQNFKQFSNPKVKENCLGTVGTILADAISDNTVEESKQFSDDNISLPCEQWKDAYKNSEWQRFFNIGKCMGKKWRLGQNKHLCEKWDKLREDGYKQNSTYKNGKFIKSFSKPSIDRLFFNNLTGKYVVYNNDEYHVDNINKDKELLDLSNIKSNSKVTKTFSEIYDAYKKGNFKFVNKIPSYN